jgi:hypothetical protein
VWEFVCGRVPYAAATALPFPRPARRTEFGPLATNWTPVYTLDEALTYALTPNLQLEFGGNFSLNNVASRAQLYVGISQRF